MGALEFHKPNGEYMRFNIDGTITTEWDVPVVEMCDKCETWQNALYGQFTASDGLTLIWLCEHCK